MTIEIQKGARADIMKSAHNLSEITIGVGWEAPGHIDIDSTVFMTDETGKCANDDAMIFYGNASSSEGSVLHSVKSDSTLSLEEFRINFTKVPSTVQKLVLTLTIHEGDKKGQTFSEMKNSFVKIINGTDQREIIVYPLGPFTIENSLVIGEIYCRNGDWKFSANTGGFSGGLAALCAHFGIEVEEEGTAAENPVVQEPVSIPDEAHLEAVKLAAQPVVQLGKITLQKPGDSISLRKASKIENIKIKLSWTKGVDLDLHAFYKTKDGKLGQVFFGNKGDINKSPFIALDKDSGVGNRAGNNEENMAVKSLDAIDSILIATNIFRFLGFASKGDNFAKYDGRVFIKTNNGDNIEVPLTSSEKGRWCIICKIDNSNPSDPKVSNINQVQSKQPDLSNF